MKEWGFFLAVTHSYINRRLCKTKLLRI